MWPLGHAAVGYLVLSLTTRWHLDRVPSAPVVAAVLLGSQLPDLVDKPLSWYGEVLPTGRSLGHSLVVLIPLCLLAYLLVRRVGRPELAAAFSIGALSHAVVDALPSLWTPDSVPVFLFYPVTTIEPYETGPPSVVGMLVEQLTSPWFHLEFVLAGLALWLWLRDGRPGRSSLRVTR